jgi:hypothetical protein
MKPQRSRRQAKLAARMAFALDAPSDAPPLPLSYEEREALKRGGLPHVVAWFARSLEVLDYAWWKHPSFDDYACGVLASQYAPRFITTDRQLLRRFPPRPLPGLGPGLIWKPG